MPWIVSERVVSSRDSWPRSRTLFKKSGLIGAAKFDGTNV